MPGENRQAVFFDDHILVTYTVDDSHHGWRVDQYLKEIYWRKSRNQLQRAIDEGLVTLPNKRVKASTQLLPGDRLQVRTPKRGEEPPIDDRFETLFEDPYLMVINKPGNLPVHPAGRYLFGNLLTILRNRYPQWTGDGRNFYLIHRLDRETSGVLLLGKEKNTATHLTDQFFERKIEKRYLAIVQGCPPDDHFTVDADIGPAGSEIRLKMAAFPAGTGERLGDAAIQTALTHFTVVKRRQQSSLVECHLETGRQHQIRVHLHHLGFPVVGDKLYGPQEQDFLDYMNAADRSDPVFEERFFSKRHFLHSHSIRFFHPVRKEWMTISAPLPADMQGAIE